MLDLAPVELVSDGDLQTGIRAFYERYGPVACPGLPVTEWDMRPSEIRHEFLRPSELALLSEIRAASA